MSSWAASTGTSTVTAPWPAGVISTAYDDPLFALKFDTEPLPTTTSLAVKPVTSSLKSASTMIGAVLVGFGASESSVAVGGVACCQITSLSVLVEAAVGLPVPSWAAPAGRDATTLPFELIPLTDTV